jgi:hypothetical protein
MELATNDSAKNLDLGQTAVNEELDAGHIAAVIRREVKYRLCDLIGRTRTSERNVRNRAPAI